ncbi:VOC family protein [Kytococcus sedentarius]|uniref:VOC family protein n=1 Tax=Kytococcus sedentarius TaxID=1276 RepID=UPI0035BC51D9
MTAQGSPIWTDLGTTDLDASRAFYRDLFGWDYTSTGPEFGDYQMIHDGQVGGMALNMGMDGELDPSMPVWWTVYLAVDDLDAILPAVTEHGGTVHVPPMDVGSMGRMAIVAAPSGAAFGLWQAKDFGGFDTSGAPGRTTWFESLTREYDADAAFYRSVLGWDNAPMGDEGEGAEMRYLTDRAGQAATAGLCEATAWLAEDVPSFWRVYFRVEDTDETVATVQRLGGALLDGPVDSPFGRVATVADNLGGQFQVIA